MVEVYGTAAVDGGRRIHHASHTHKNTQKSNNHGTEIRRQQPPVTHIDPPTRLSARQHYPSIRSGAIAALGVLLTVPYHPQHHTTRRNPTLLILTVLVLGDGSSYRNPAAAADCG